MKRDYFEDVRWLNSGAAWFWLMALLAFLVTIPVWSHLGFLPDLSEINHILIFVIVAVGLNLLVGYTGQVSLGHAGFYAVGGFTAFVVMYYLGLPFWLALPVGGLLAAAFGWVLGLLALRLEGPYLAIATIGFGIAIQRIIKAFPFFGFGDTVKLPGYKSVSLTWFGQNLPVSGLDRALVAPDGTPSMTVNYYLIVIVCVLLTWAARNLAKTRVGRALVAIRDSDVAAETMGVSLLKYKTMAFAISAFYAGVAGGLLCVNEGGNLSADTMDIILSITFLAMVVVGGTGAILGGVMGGLLLGFLEFELDFSSSRPGVMPWLKDTFTYLTNLLGMRHEGMGDARFIIYGLIMIGIMIFEPLGLYGIWIRAKRYWRTWPF
jgi:branched-chain amino acid transport system permease protein